MDLKYLRQVLFFVVILLSFKLVGCASVRGGFAEGCRQKCRENYMDMAGRNECMKGCEFH